ncbi:hypothetical protein [Neorhizobium sp. NCHU2750]|uniref:hypothetical protein n=1 Tax=Neorhizobium sp. NCHU2750 TaxID=1825976 RepID=UPI000E7326EA|nr:hypothetical protein NCHU2750_45100 [Neorhizobium sp. NCHU2750]
MEDVSLYEPIEDAYGPGSDLMISLFAIAMLLLGIVGVGQQIGQAAPSSTLPTPAQKTGQTKLQDLVSRQAFDKQARLLAAAAEETDRLKRQNSLQADELKEKERLLTAAGEALSLAQSRLEILSSQASPGYQDIGQFFISAKSLAPFFTDASKLRLSLDRDMLARMIAKARPLPPGANEILIETFMPPQILALIPAGLADEGAMNAIYLLSGRLAAAYREAFAAAGFPLACIRVNPGSFENAPELRRSIMIESEDAIHAFSEMATYYRGLSSEEISKAKASIDIRLGTTRDGLCDPGRLMKRLQDL